jgi:hypothetical protein
MFQTNVVDKMTTHILCSITFSLKGAVYDIMWKSIRERGGQQMTIWRMRIACWIPKATNIHSGFECLLLLHCNSGWTNTPQCYVIRTLPVLFVFYIYLLLGEISN